MPILSHIGRHSSSQRLAVVGIYAFLSLFGATMVLPFLMTVTSSVSNDFDYQRFQPVPRALYSRDDRFLRGMVEFFNNYAGWPGQLAADFPGMPPGWTGWAAIGRDTDGSDRLAARYLGAPPAERRAFEVMARDYADFAEAYPVADSVTPVDRNRVAGFLADSFGARWAAAHPQAAAHALPWERRREALRLLNETWGIPFPDFGQILFDPELASPLWQQSWLPPRNPKFQSYVELQQAYKDLRFMPGIESKWRAYVAAHGGAPAGEGALFPVTAASPPALRALWLRFREEVAPLSPTVPYALRVEWRRYLQSETVHARLDLALSESFDLARYNALAGTGYASWDQLPFPLPSDAPPALRGLWDDFVEHDYPLRLTALTVTPDLRLRFGRFLEARFRSVRAFGILMGTSYRTWDEVPLSARPPQEDAREQKVWVDFVKTLPAPERSVDSSEASFQRFLLGRYGSLDGINRAWGTSYGRPEEIFPPVDKAYAVTFAHNEAVLALGSALSNYGTIADFLFLRSNSVPVTLALVVLSILCSLTINPIAAYALSRFNLRSQDKILLFLLATSAFPAMVSAIPGYLLMRDLGMLNTFFALVLPGAANGMAIFILKGFFDSLPPELFEAATIDGAKEWQIFLHVTMPMVKPILAINALTAFLSAYERWDWALIICQDPKMWTLSVWMYQASLWWNQTPWIVNAGFILISIPTLVVFLTCQNVILKGIIIPQMK